VEVPQVQAGLGEIQSTACSYSSTRLIDTARWEGMNAQQVVAHATTLRPSGRQGEAITYVGPDLFWAGPMASEALALEYTPPRPDFKAGLGFVRRSRWLALAAGNVEVTRWVQNGYSELVRGEVPYIDKPNNPNTSPHAEFVAKEIASLLAVGAIREVTDRALDPQVVRVIAPLTVAVQGGGKKRLCYNARAFNEYLEVKHFKMEHADVAARLIRPGDFMFTIDCKSGYHQFPVTPFFSRFLCFRWEGKVYQWLVMPFGLSPAPRAYSKLMRVVVQRWRAMGIRVSTYIDDLIFFASSREEALRVRALVLRDLQDLGLFINLKKSMLEPGTMVTYLGMVFCSLPTPHLRVPETKVGALQASFQAVLKQEQRRGKGVEVTVGGRKLASILGFLQSFRLAIPMVGVMSRELQACLTHLPHLHTGWIDYQAEAVLSAGALEECRFWAAQVRQWNGFVIPPSRVSRILYTDGSGQGFGGVVHRVLGRRVEPAFQVQAGVWEAGTSVDSVFTELQGLWRALVAAGSELQGQVVLHRTDSISTYGVVAKGGCQSSPRLTDVVRRVQVYCLSFGITLAIQYVGAGVIIKSGADALSRLEDTSDCKLHPHVFGRLWHVMGPFVADMFASRASVQSHPVMGAPLPYWALWVDGMSQGVDALAALWPRVGVAYAFPPVHLAGQVIRLILDQSVKAVVVLPRWPAQWWWPLVQEHGRLQADLDRLSGSESLFIATHAKGRNHPLGPSFSHPASVCWVAVLFAPKG
jgi:hypothetical protein